MDHYRTSLSAFADEFIHDAEGGGANPMFVVEI